MNARNDQRRYGWIAVTLHWGMALLVVGLFALGLWMTGLGYYDPWYRKGPDLHRTLGVVLFALLIARLGWRRLNPQPAPEPTHAPWERLAAHCAHRALYLLLILISVSGYLISTADGRPIQLFGALELPALIHGIDQQEEYAGTAHLWLAIAALSLAALHAGAALKHHFIDRDRTLLKMLGR